MPSDEYKAFRDLDKAVEKSKLVLDLTSDEPIHVWRFDLAGGQIIGEDTIRNKIYKFDGNIQIVKEEHKEHGSRSERVTGFPECRYEHLPHNGELEVFYVFKGNSLVSDGKEAKEIIQRVTGVNLPKLDATYDKGSEGHKVVTSSSLKGDYQVFGKQPNEHELASGAYELREKIRKLSEETGISTRKLTPNILSKELELSKKQVMPVLDELKGIITKYSEIYDRKYSTKDKSMQRAIEAMIRSHQ